MLCVVCFQLVAVPRHHFEILDENVLLVIALALALRVLLFALSCVHLSGDTKRPSRIFHISTKNEKRECTVAVPVPKEHTQGQG